MADSNISQVDVFFEIHSDLPRQSAGSVNSTIRALDLVQQFLPESALIADIGCGPGSSVLPLAIALPSATFQAIDLHQPFLEELQERAEKAGLQKRINVHQADMNSLPCDENSLDMIWCEGAIYNIGVKAGLQSWQKFLKPNGILVFNEPVWLLAESERPREAIEFWLEYPALTDATSLKDIISEAGYTLLNEFDLPESDWWDEYYDPLESKIGALEAKYQNNQEAMIPIASTRHEIEIRRQCASSYNYRFFVCRLPKTGDV